jgi:hypothetical protein
MYLTTKDVLDHARRTLADGKRVAIACLSMRGDVRDEILREHGIDPKALTIAQPTLVRHQWESGGELVERLVLEGAQLVYVLSASTQWGDAVWTLAYAGEPLASVADVDDALAAGDALDVRAGELWIESPPASGQWFRIGQVLDSVAAALRARGVAVA